MFNDSLPDGWGRPLLDRRLQRAGIDYHLLTPLDRLWAVGKMEWERWRTFPSYPTRRNLPRTWTGIGSSSRESWRQFPHLVLHSFGRFR
ncbi:hypothetical protein [Rhizobium mongolense]|uniref:hypothetical protein n=1 Tax=Rhizobium mongolense TaxID=57676 RepID=UPI0034A36CB5